jgi:hypothetical protein
LMLRKIVHSLLSLVYFERLKVIRQHTAMLRSLRAANMRYAFRLTNLESATQYYFLNFKVQLPKKPHKRCCRLSWERLLVEIRLVDGCLCFRLKLAYSFSD